MKKIEGIILKSHIDELVTLSPNELHNLVFSFKQLRSQSEILYFMEPHILKHIKSFNPNQVARITSSYFMLKQGSIDFLKQMTSVAALICHSIKLNPLIWLIQEIKVVKDFSREVRILLEFGIVP